MSMPQETKQTQEGMTIQIKVMEGMDIHLKDKNIVNIR